jgi:hypothetical protein
MALEEQRRVFEKTTGEKPEKKAKKRREAPEDLLEEEDEEEETEDEETAEHLDVEDDDEESEEEEDDEDGESFAELKGAKKALRRIDAPDWVFKQSRKRILELAESMAAWQANNDKGLRTKFDRIRAEEAGDRTKSEAAQETRNGAVSQYPPPADLKQAASRMASALGVEEDKQALADLEEGLRGAVGDTDAHLRALHDRQRASEGLVERMILRDARGALRGDYPQLVSDPEAFAELKEALEWHAAKGGTDDLDALYRKAARTAFGPSKKKEGGRRQTKRRKTSGPAAKAKRPPAKQKLSADRALFDRIHRKDRGRLAAGR